MKNYIQRGENITFPAPYDVVSGAPALIGGVAGGIVGIASTNALAGEDCAFVRIGVFTPLPKAAGVAWVAGSTKLYFDNAAKNFTTVAAGNTLVGVAAAGALAADTTGSVLLTGQIG